MNESPDTDIDRSDRAALRDLGWADPPSVPAHPGADLAWEVAVADDVEFLVASEPDNPDAWIASATPDDVYEH